MAGRGKGGVDDAMKVQLQIRQNAEEISDFFSDMKKWEKVIKKKDQTLTRKSAPVVATGAAKVRQSGTVHTTTTAVPSADKKKTSTPFPAGSSSGEEVHDVPVKSAASHTHDKGYEKWEKFDVDRALEEVADTAEVDKNKGGEEDEEEGEEHTSSSSAKLTPATIVKIASAPAAVRVPKARGEAVAVDAESAERERGNEYYKNGNFANSIKSYTKCLGMKVRNYVAFSNRAMAYIKMKDYVRAEIDCACALSIEPTHIKSLLRRAQVRVLVCKYRAAISDLVMVMEIDPSNKQARGDMLKTKELLRNASSRAPMIKIPVTVYRDDGGNGDFLSLQGPSYKPAESTASSSGSSNSISGISNGSDTVADANQEGGVQGVDINSSSKIAFTDIRDKPLPPASATSGSNGSIVKKVALGAKKNVGTKSSVTFSGGSSTTYTSIYDLERAIFSVDMTNVDSLKKVFDLVDEKDAVKILSSSMESDAVFLFLSAMYSYYKLTNQPLKIILWFKQFSKVSSFSLLKSLFTAKQQSDITEMFLYMLEAYRELEGDINEIFDIYSC